MSVVPSESSSAMRSMPPANVFSRITAAIPQAAGSFVNSTCSLRTASVMGAPGAKEYPRRSAPAQPPAQATFSTSSSTASTVPVSTLAVPTKRAT